jgi:uncharacterized protein (TIGR02001 family)
MKLIRFSVVAALFATSIFANEDSTGINVSANMSLTSNYVWRGMTQTKDSPAIQGGVDLEYKGLYAGVWGSNVDFGVNDNNSLELDIYGGYAGEVAGIGYDVGYIQYAYPNKSDEYNFGEAYVGVSKEWDKFALSAKQSFGIETDDTNPEDFYEVGASTSVLPYDVGFDASYGNYDNIGYYYSLGLSRSFEKFDLSLAYIDFSHDTDSTADEDTVVATVSFAF